MATTPLDDNVLMDRWQAGDAAAGESLVERYFDQLYNFFHTKLDADADELVQLTFLACLDAKDRFRREASFRTFLYAIAKNQLYSMLRTRVRAGRELELDGSSIADLVSTPRTRLARNQEYEHLVTCLRRLPVEQQTLLELHYWSELGMSELAAIFEAPEVTIRSRLHRARTALRALLQAASSDQAGASLEQIDEWARTLSQIRPR